MKGLVIRSPWIDMILSGDKTWEIRGSRTARRGRIALIQSGTKTVVGVCDLIDVEGPLSMSKLLANQPKHRIPAARLRRDGMPYKRTFAWVLAHAARLPEPVAYEHPTGAVIWVDLPHLDL